MTTDGNRGADLYGWAERLESDESLDPLVAALDRRIPDMLRRRPWKQRLAGTWLGHALHPMLTDIPIGCWVSATVLDLLGPRRWRVASATLTGTGLLAALPTAASGAVEWLDAPRQARRVGAVHAVANSAATGLYLGSFIAKITGRARVGVLLAVSGGAAAAAGGYLGSHLSFARGVGVDQATQQRDRPVPFRGRIVGPGLMDIDGTRFLRADDGVAVPDRCTRCGSNLERTTAGLLRCTADESTFDAIGDTVVQGPATTPLPRFRFRDDGDDEVVFEGLEQGTRA